MTSRSIRRSFSSIPSASSPFPQYIYDVFLSFGGEDTRKNFTDHLYAALDQKGIVTFRDDEKLERGKPIAPKLLKAIEESRFSVVVLSRNYASSTWCLDELAKILECMKEMRQTVLPIFYDVDPSEVRKQTGSFEKAFEKHEEIFKDNLEKVQGWRAALTEVANLSGWDLKDGHESKFIQEIATQILSRLSQTIPGVTKYLVGIDTGMAEMNLFLGTGLDDIRIIGICGMGGIGKTTLATLVFHRIAGQFEGCSFLANVREVSEKSGLLRLQEQLLCEILIEKNIKIWDFYRGANAIRSRLQYKKILLVLDDVDKLEQLENLAGNHDWFGSGSRIIITTRDKHLLISYGVDKIYEAQGLNYKESLQLFSMRAFKKDNPPGDYMTLSNLALNYANGLPLALEVLGSHLFGRSIDEWRSALDRLKEAPDKNIQEILKISYDGLELMEKNLFLDIACFFSLNRDKAPVIEILDSCGFYPDIGIRVLADKSLVTVIMNYMAMHPLLQEMGREIVRQESPKEPSKRSRLWHINDVYHVLLNNKGTEVIEGIVLDYPAQEVVCLNAEAFLNMSKLRVLKIGNMHLSQGLNYLPNELRYLSWEGYSLKSLPSSFQPDKIVELSLCYSHIEQLWKGKKAPLRLDKLKTIQLSHSRNLKMTPDFTAVPNLEKLILDSCTSLSTIHPSIAVLKRLIILNLNNCKSLRELPESIGHLECLEELDIGGTSIRKTPPCFAVLKNLKRLSFRGCKELPPAALTSFCWFWLMPRNNIDSLVFSLPPLTNLCSLTKLDLSDCNLRALPNVLGSLTSLEKADLSRNSFVTIPSSIIQLRNLLIIRLNSCKQLQSLPEFPSSTILVIAEDCTSLKTVSNPFLTCKWTTVGFSFVNCYNLVENQSGKSVELTMLKRYLLSSQKMRPKGGNYWLPYCSLPYYGSILPGNRIPPWFTYQNMGSSLSIPVHRYDSKLMGIAVYAIFRIVDSTVLFENLGSGDYAYIRCVIKDASVGTIVAGPDIPLCRGTGVESDHCFLLYIPNIGLERVPDEREEGCDIQASFTISTPCIQVTNCGLRLVCEKDVEDFLHDDIEEVVADGSMVRQSSDDYLDGVDYCGSGNSNEDSYGHT